MNENKDNFGKKIKVLREQNNITQEELANKLNVTRQAISNWERSHTIPDIDTINKISKMFALTIDEIMSEKSEIIEKQYDRKMTRLMYIASIILVVSNIIIDLFNIFEIKANMFMIIIMLIIETTIYFSLGNAIKNDDFSIIAGYDSKAEYNMPVFKKTLMSIENHVMLLTLIFIMIFSVIEYMNVPKILPPILLISYIIEFIISIIFINIRNHDKLFINRKDRMKSMISAIITGIFTLLLFLCIGTMIFTVEYYNIENNTYESLIMLVFLFPNIILILIGLFYEQYRMKKLIDKNLKYKPSKFSYIATILCIVLLIGMIILASSF
ncbi:helix-turn-helix transcriptional regulator [Clostridium sp. D2Q-14]|uniref:helix-turn-helix domain-containing protein n=1 Tax=Anaeromonas gelatinilytica TaxID=2683194 RepID=UPI00193C7E9F|nr:helix-turn-helix transcriptional regulator [Anaeromonas gelatinilytica]MBS4536153.1 helix-turn-helix transcriptional regulator [Anaeromonas gelatinilytica]